MIVLNRELHLGLLVASFLLVLIGCVVIYSATSEDFQVALRHFRFGVIGMALAVFIFTRDLRFIYNFTWFAYLVSIGFLIAVFFVGRASHGAVRWIPIGSFAFQPSELAKITIILALSRYMRAHLEHHRRFHFIMVASLIVGVPLILILKQPDLGTAITLVPVLIGISFMARVHTRYFLLLLPFALIPIIVLGLAKTQKIDTDDLRHLLRFLKPYQQNRLLVFVDPNIDPRGMSYNLNQSQIAIGSGEKFGKGYLKGTQTRLQFLPERHTDFIFSVLGEEWGFAGSIALLLLYLYILRTGLAIADSCEDYFPKLGSIGIVILLLTHVVTNMGMTIGLMPITGLPLPLISYGGSSLFMTFIAIGLLLNFHANRGKVLSRT